MKLLNEDQFKIIEKVKLQGALSVDQLTSWLKKPKTAVRRALLNLEKRGLVQRQLRKSHRGRPALYFVLGAQANAIFPTKEAELLSEMMKFLIKNGHRTLLEEFFKEFWEKRYNRVIEKISKRKCRDLTSRLEALKEVLNEDGFYARSQISNKQNQVVLKECHCPISAAASVVEIPCQLESQLISRVLNLESISSAPMSNSQEACHFVLKTKKTAIK